MRKGAEIDFILLQQDNARPHTSVTTNTTARSQGCSKPVVLGERKIFFLRTEFKILLNDCKGVLKLEEITCTSDYAQS